MTIGISVNVFAGEYDENEKYVIKQISSENFPAKIEARYINQLENYFCRDEVKLDKMDAEDFVSYLKDAMLEKEQLGKNIKFDKFSSVYQNFQKAGTIIGLLVEYDSSVNGFYAIDEFGYVVIDTQKVIKDTDKNSKNNNENKWNISIELIFTGVIILCILGVLANLRRWNRKMKRHSNYDDEDEDEDEPEVANRKTRRARLQTFSYQSIKQILRYFYVPIIMGLAVVIVAAVFIGRYSDIIESIDTNFINTQPIYSHDQKDFVPIDVAADKQAKEVDLQQIAYPKYGENYGVLKCESLGLNTPVYCGDDGMILKKGAGTYLGSMIPGMNRPVIIGAHDTTYFSKLQNVKKKDKFTFTTEYGIYEYEVTGFEIYDEGNYDEAYDLKSDKEQLILYTCYPFGTLNGTKTERMFIYLDKVNGPDIKY